MDRSGQTLSDKYKVVSLLGRGGMGEVWQGAHLRTGRKVAIKFLDEVFREHANVVERFGREARAASAIQHPGIVEVLDRGSTADGLPFIVMEFLAGETLSSRIERRKRLTQAETLAVFTQLLEALDAAHASGVLHRDLKPDNIFLVPSAEGGGETVKILDFGISQKSDEVRSRLTQTGSVLGTPHYMPPEQARGDASIDARADIYAAGICFYECVVGDVPFDAANYNALLQIILLADPAPPRQRGAEIDPAIESVVLRAIAKNRDARPASAGAFRRLLDDAASGRNAKAQPLSAPAPATSDRGWSAANVAQAELVAPPRRVGSAVMAPPSSAGSGVVASASAPGLDDLGADFLPEPPPIDLDPVALAHVSARPAGRTSVRTGQRSVQAVPVAEPPARWRVWVAAAIAVALVAFAVGALRLMARRTDAVPPPAPVAEGPQRPAIEAQPDSVEIYVSDLPEGSRLRLDGIPTLSNPMRVSRGGSHRIDVEAPGFERKQLRIQADRDQTVNPELVPEVGDSLTAPH